MQPHMNHPIVNLAGECGYASVGHCIYLQVHSSTATCTLELVAVQYCNFYT